MKRKLCIGISFSLLLVVYLVFFFRASRTYVFSHPVEDIISVDFLINANEVGKAEEDKLIFQKSLSAEEVKSFMSEIYELETRRSYPPMWGWGDYVARVTYSNGDVELLGSGNIEYVENGSSATGDGFFVFWEYGVFEEVFLRYLG